MMRWRRLFIRTAFRLPELVLRTMAGPPDIRRGAPLDVRFQIMANNSRRMPKITHFSPNQIRASVLAARLLTDARPDPACRTRKLTIDLGDRQLSALLHSPVHPRPNAPLTVYYHSGGGVIGDPPLAAVFCSYVVAALRGPVLSIDYRLGPEHKWPAGVEDAVDTFLWARAHCDRFGVASHRIGVGGDSMGGNFAAIVPLQMKRMGQAQPLFQLLLYPLTDAVNAFPSEYEMRDAFPLDEAALAWFKGHYLPQDADLADLRISPMLAPDHAGLAPALVYTAGFDPLVDQGAAYAKVLAAAGTPSSYRNFPSLAHGFTSYLGLVPAARRACRLVAAELAVRIETIDTSQAPILR